MPPAGRSAATLSGAAGRRGEGGAGPARAGDAGEAREGPGEGGRGKWTVGEGNLPRQRSTCTADVANARRNTDLGGVGGGRVGTRGEGGIDMNLSGLQHLYAHDGPFLSLYLD